MGLGLRANYLTAIIAQRLNTNKWF